MRNTFNAEFEIHASKKMLFPYIFTASGLSQWMADDVTVDEDKVFNFKWEGEDHKAKMITHRINNFVKFEFLPEDDDDDEEPKFIEVRLEMNELTQMVFIAITDFNDIDDDEELQDLWESLIHSLKEIVGG
jgi:uncharacterized protein YndB with AHSA1/START domain